MSQSISGTYIGTAGTRTRGAGTGLKQGSLHSFSTLAYPSVVQGGAGYSYTQYGVSGSGGAGGIGVVVNDDLVNFGTVTGGAGGDGLIPTTGSSNGGIGVRFSDTAHLVNYGRIVGGAGGTGGRDSAKLDGAGGIGADLTTGGFVANFGLIEGGTGGQNYALNDPRGGAGGIGLFFGAKGTLDNHGDIAGGNGGTSSAYIGGTGGVGVQMKAGGYLQVYGAVSVIGGNGGAGQESGGTGGTGGDGILLESAGNVTIGGNVHGGNGGNSSEVAGAGGTGISLTAAGFVSNYSIVTGGAGGNGGPVPVGFGASGGTGIALGRGAALFNFTQVIGGEGGNVSGAGGAGAILKGGATLADLNFGLISGGAAEPSLGGGLGYGGIGLELLKAGTFRNIGTITGGIGAVAKVHASISYGGGAYLAGGSTLINSGTIVETGNSDAVLFGGSGRSTLLLDPGSVIKGAVEAQGTHNVVALYGVPTATYLTTLTGLGTNYTGFQTLQSDAGSVWDVSGSIATVVNNGTIAIGAGTSLDVTTAVAKSSTGEFALTSGASLEVAAALGTNLQIDFLGSGNLLTIDDPAAFGQHVGKTNYAGPLLEDFSAGNTIDLKGVSSLDYAYNSLSGVLQIKSGSAVFANLAFQTASLGSGSFHLVGDNAGGVLLTRS